MSEPCRIHIISDSDDSVSARAFEFFCRHVVCLQGAYQPLDDAGKRLGDLKFFGYAGSVLSLRGVWYFLTAGHILSGLDEHVERARIRITQCVLVDSFGRGSVSRHPIPFDYQGAPRCYVDEDGLDFGLVGLSGNCQCLLRANGITPISEEYWSWHHTRRFEHHFMVGLPEEFHESYVADGEMYGGVSPTMLAVTEIDLPEDIAPTSYPRFVGRLRDDLPIASPVGMSGGLIFGFARGLTNRYWTVAIQSSWLRDRKIVFGCPVPILGHLIEKELAEAET